MIYKRGKWFWMDDTVNTVRYREPLKTTSRQEALRLERERIAEILAGKGPGPHTAARETLVSAIALHLERRRLFAAPGTFTSEQQRSRPLLRFFGDTKIKRVTSEMISEYQIKRASEGVSGCTVNLEVGLLRLVLKKAKQWSRLADDVENLPVSRKEIRVLLPEEKARLIETAASRPEWLVAYCAAQLALNTTMRGCELKGLRWRDVDLFERTLKIRRASTKTDAGARVIPLNRDAIVALGLLWDRSRNLKAALPEHYVLPACESGHINPIKAMKTWSSAWGSLTKAAELSGLRFHDLRHQAVTELAESGLPDEVIMSIAGHVSREMLAHYSHIRLAAKRRALESLESPLLDSQPAIETHYEPAAPGAGERPASDPSGPDSAMAERLPDPSDGRPN